MVTDSRYLTYSDKTIEYLRDLDMKAEKNGILK
jgi:hypothetical protein